jgi:hypothetical protein
VDIPAADLRKTFRFKFEVRGCVSSCWQYVRPRHVLLGLVASVGGGCCSLQNEAGLDAGGLAREWFEEVTRRVFDTSFGLFAFSHVDNLSYQVNAQSAIAQPGVCLPLCRVLTHPWMAQTCVVLLCVQLRRSPADVSVCWTRHRQGAV